MFGFVCCGFLAGEQATEFLLFLTSRTWLQVQASEITRNGRARSRAVTDRKSFCTDLAERVAALADNYGLIYLGDPALHHAGSSIRRACTVVCQL